MFVATVLAPQSPEHAQLNRVGLPAQPLHDEAVLSLGEGYFVQDLLGDGQGIPTFQQSFELMAPIR